ERVSVAWSGRDLAVTTPRGGCKLHWIDPFAADISEAATAGGIVAPVPGTGTPLLPQPRGGGAPGAPPIRPGAKNMGDTPRGAPAGGRRKALKCAVGDFVQEGAELADFEATEMETAN